MIKIQFRYLLITVSLLALPLGHARSGADIKSISGTGTMNYHDIIRSYRYQLPAHIPSGTGKIPLVIVLHGGGGNAKSAARTTGFSRKAEQEGFMVVYPEGSGRFRGRFLTWNVTHCCGFAMKKNRDDVGFISALIDQLVAEYPIDPERVFVTGMSNGGMMAHRSGLALTDKIAAIAPVASGLFGDEPEPRRPLPTLIINGSLDKSFPLKGGQAGGLFRKSWDGTPLMPVGFQSAFWAKANHCEDKPDEKKTETVIVLGYKCPAGQDVIHYIVRDNGHAWPGGKKGFRRADNPSDALNATDVIWDFFVQQFRQPVNTDIE